MKKLKKILIVSAVSTFLATSAFGYQYNLNVTGERTQSGYGITGHISNAYYNPVGLVQLKDGIYFDLGNRFLWLDKKSQGSAINDLSGGAYSETKAESSQWSFLLPNLALAWKHGKGAVFFSTDIRDGGAGGEWKAGEGAQSIALYLSEDPGIGASTTRVKAKSFSFAYTAGASYQLTNMVAVGAAFRAIHRYEKVEMVGGDLTTKTEEYGFTPVLNILVTPLKGLNFSLQWQGGTTLRGTLEESGSSNSDSQSYQPDLLAMGVGYNVFKGLDVYFSYVIEFGGEYKINKVVLENEKGKHTHKIGIGGQYQIIPLIAVSLGVMFQTTDTNNANNGNFTNAAFNQLNIGGGVVISPLPNLDIEIGLSNQFYFESEYTNGISALPGTMTHNQNAFILSLGANYRL